MYTNSAVAAVVVEIEQNVIKQARLEIFFQIISVFIFIFELRCYLDTTQGTLVNLGFILGGVVKKHNFCTIQQKILQISNFAKKRDLNPLPHGDVADNIVEMFANFLLQKSDFASKNTIFAKI
jgi:hypothetical protein